MYSFRNSLMKITVFIEFGALTCGLGMMIGGFFGMNLHSGLEDSNYAFIITVGCTCALMLTVLGWLLLVSWIEIDSIQYSRNIVYISTAFYRPITDFIMTQLQPTASIS